MNQLIKQMFKYLGAFFGIILLFNILLFVVCLIPSELTRENVSKTSVKLIEDGPYHIVYDPFIVRVNTQTDAVIANEVLSVDNEKPFYSYLAGRKNYNKEITQQTIEENIGEGVTANFDSNLKLEVVDTAYDSIGELKDFLNGNIHTAIQYGRYWHGNWVLYRPLFVLFGITQIRILLLVLLLALLITASILIYKKYGLNVAIIYFFSIMLTSYVSVSYSLESSPIFLLSMIATIIVTLRKDKEKTPYLFFFILGMIVNFIDYFTVPLIPFFLPMALLLLDYKKEHNLKECFIYLVKSAINYAAGYALTWIFKWILFDLFVPANTSMLKIGFEQSFYRMGRTNDYAREKISLPSIILNTVFAYIAYIVIIYVVLSIKKELKNKDEQENKKKIKIYFKDPNALFLLIAISPFVWFFIAQNHNLLHFHFTFRMYVIFMIGTLLFLNNTFLEEKK